MKTKAFLQLLINAWADTFEDEGMDEQVKAEVELINAMERHGLKTSGMEQWCLGATHDEIMEADLKSIVEESLDGEVEEVGKFNGTFESLTRRVRTLLESKGFTLSSTGGGCWEFDRPAGGDYHYAITDGESGVDALVWEPTWHAWLYNGSEQLDMLEENGSLDSAIAACEKHKGQRWERGRIYDREWMLLYDPNDPMTEALKKVKEVALEDLKNGNFHWDSFEEEYLSMKAEIEDATVNPDGTIKKVYAGEEV